MSKFIPPTLKQAEDYVREKNLSVDPEWFINYFEANDWKDSNNKIVKSWKQKMWTLHRMQQNWSRPHKCQICGKPGVYIKGYGTDGFPYFTCIDHKPKPKPVPEQIKTIETLKTKIVKEKDLAKESNEQVRKLLGRN